jgi:hypothetical protein
VLVDLKSLPLPMNFVSMNPAGYLVKYPYKMPRVVPLHVAVQHRGLDLDTIDFLFHGSAMSWLAKRDNPIHEHLVGVVLPHSKNIVSVSKQREYTQDHTVAGFQFERLVTGKTFTDPHGIESVEHLHVMKVGNYTILFCAEVDAMTAEGNPAEVSTTYWVQNKLFQMISNGSSTLCAGVKNYGSLVKVQMTTLSSIISSQSDLASSWTQNIVRGLDALNDTSFAPGEPFEIAFEGEKVILKQNSYPDLLPPNEVIKDLLLQDGK